MTAVSLVAGCRGLDPLSGSQGPLEIYTTPSAQMRSAHLQSTHLSPEYHREAKPVMLFARLSCHPVSHLSSKGLSPHGLSSPGVREATQGQCRECGCPLNSDGQWPLLPVFV